MATVDGKVDPQRAERLKRFTSPTATFDSWLQADAKIHDITLKAMNPPADASPEQLAAWRGERGLPIQAQDYEIPLAAGLKADQLDEGQKASIEGFQKLALNLNLSKPQAAAVAKYHNEMMEKAAVDSMTRDAILADKLEESLRLEWGPSYKNHVAQTAVYFQREVGADGWENILEARLPDGTRLVNNAKFAKFFHKVAADMDGGVILESGSGGVPGTSVEGRIAEIAKIMNTNFAQYNADPDMRREYADLLQRQEERNRRLGKT